MAIDLSNLRKVKAINPPRFVIYGPQGTGKTSLAAEFPKPVFIQTEDGATSDIEIDSFGILSSYVEVMQALASLAMQDHEFKTVIIDTVDKLEPLLQQQVAAENGWPNIEAPDYGKGYTACDGKWQEFISALDYIRNHKGMTVVILAHCDVQKFQSPGMEPYSRYGLRMHKRAVNLVSDWCDAIGFLNFRTEVKKTEAGFNKTATHAEGNGIRWLAWEQRPAFTAKNRYGFDADMMVLKGKTVEQLAAKSPIQN